MPASISSVNRLHGSEGGDSPDRSSMRPIGQIAEGRVRRYWRRVWATGRFLWHSLSILGTVTMLAYQFIYPWQLLPRWLMWMMPSPGASAWFVGLLMLVLYIVSKMPHLIGQEPGDALGLVREVLLNEINIAVGVVFLTRVHDGMNHPPNAVGILTLFLVAFIGLLIAELVQSIVLARRTWTDSTTAAQGT